MPAIERDWNAASGLKAASWIGIYGVILCSWVALIAMDVGEVGWEAVRIYGWEAIWEFCRLDPASAAPGTVLGMWLAMTAAMMLPGIVPALSTYEQLLEAGAGKGGGGTAELVFGYLAVWSGFSVAASSIQIWMAAPLQMFSSVSGPIALALAGLYQFSPWKTACVEKCRHPLAVFIRYWSSARWNAFGLGLRIGLYCFGCCWLLMSYSLIAGTMNLAWIGVATLFMTIEKLPQIGRFVEKPAAVVLLSLALWQGIT